MAIDWSKLLYTQTSTPYLDSYNKLADSYNTQAKTDIENMNTRQTEDLNKSNAGYDNSARQNWINYMQAQKRLPSQLNALGIRGGASESSAIRLGTNYGSNVASNEAARQSAANDIRSAYAQQIADYNKDLNERLATARATAEQNQMNWEREQLEKDLQYFSGAIEGLYNDRGSYLKLIDKLQASNDPNKEYKIMLATRAMNMLGATSGGSGGRGGRSYGYGGSGYGDDATTISDADAKALAGNLVENAAYYVGNTASSVNSKKPRNIKGDFLQDTTSKRIYATTTPKKAATSGKKVAKAVKNAYKKAVSNQKTYKARRNGVYE